MAMQKKKTSKELALAGANDTLMMSGMATFERRVKILVMAIIQVALDKGYVIRFDHLGNGIFELEMPPVGSEKRIISGKLFSLLLWVEGFMVSILGYPETEIGNPLYHMLQCDCETCEFNLAQITQVLVAGKVPSYFEMAQRSAAQKVVLDNVKGKNNPN